MAWRNSKYGLGTDGFGLYQTTFGYDGRLTRDTLEALDEQGGISRKILRRMPLDAMREGWERCAFLSEDDARALAKEEARLKLKFVLYRYLVLRRLYGGAAVIMYAEDGREMHEPLDVDRVRQVRGVRSFHAWELWPHTYVDDEDSPDDGEPEVYQVTPDSNWGASARTFYVHRSRMLMSEGEPASNNQRARRWGWGVPLFEQCWNELRNSGLADLSTVDYLQQLSIPAVYKKLKGQMSARQGAKAKMATAMTELRQALTQWRVMLLDADDRVERFNAQVAGIKELLEHNYMQLSAVADYAQTVLYGRSPAGLNASGTSDLELYYGAVNAKEQEPHLRPVLEGLYPRLLQAPVWGGGDVTNPVPLDQRKEDPGIVFNPLWVPSEQEQAQTMQAKASAYQVYGGMGWLDADEGRALLEREGVVEPIDLEDEPEHRHGPGEPPTIDDEEVERADAAPVLMWRGHQIRVEYAPGDAREFPGTPWPPAVMPCYYGEIVGTKGLDGEPVDVLWLTPGETMHAGIIVNPEDGSLDEAKIVLGAPDEHAASSLLSLVYGGLHVGNVVQVEPEYADALIGVSSRTDADVPEDLRRPTEAMARNAAAALRVRATKPPSQRGMTAVGLARARDIMNRRPLSVATWRRLLSFLQRHEVDKQGETWPDKGKGWQAYKGWGGDPGVVRARRVIAASERKDRG